MATSTERQPVQADRGLLRTCRGAEGCADAGSRHAATIPWRGAERSRRKPTEARRRLRGTGPALASAPSAVLQLPRESALGRIVAPLLLLVQGGESERASSEAA
jgi:hypothetical protein